jgi:hypothetical protein
MCCARFLHVFFAERALPTVALEASSMFRSASIARPAAAVELVLKPLVARIRAQLPEKGALHVLMSSVRCCCCCVMLLSLLKTGGSELTFCHLAREMIVFWLSRDSCWLNAVGCGWGGIVARPKMC